MDSTNKMVVVYFEDTFAQNDDKEGKLRSFFEDANLTSGGEIEKVNLNRNNANQAFIYFKEKDVAERVAKQKNIRIAAYKFTVKLNNKKSNNQLGDNRNRDPYEEFNTDEEPVQPKKQPQQKENKSTVDKPRNNNNNNNNSINKMSSHLNKRPIIIDGNNVGMR